MYWPHLSIEEVKSLSADELDMLLYLVNVEFPVMGFAKSEINPHPVSEKLLTTIHREALKQMLDSVFPKITDEGKLIYESLKQKIEKTYEPKRDEPNSGSSEPIESGKTGNDSDGSKQGSN